MDELLIGSAFGLGIVTTLLFKWVFSMAVAREANKRACSLGRDKRKEYADELMEAITQCLLLMKEGKKADEAMKIVAGQHPQVAMRLVAAFAKKGIGIDVPIT